MFVTAGIAVQVKPSELYDPVKLDPVLGQPEHQTPWVAPALRLRLLQDVVTSLRSSDPARRSNPAAFVVR